VPAEMFADAPFQIIRRAGVEAPSRFTLKDVDDAHRRMRNDGRPVGTRTPDLYRVKAP